jgi:hypothetical protein
VFSNRAYFLFDKLPGELAVQNAKDSDTGIIIYYINYHNKCSCEMKNNAEMRCERRKCVFFMPDTSDEQKKVNFIKISFTF